MKTVALIVAVGGLALAGCGAGSRAPSHGHRPPAPGTSTQGAPGEGPPAQEPPHQGGAAAFVAPTTTTIANSRTGATMRCVNHGIAAGAKVPPPGQDVTDSVDGTSSSATIDLTRKSDGSLVVSCTG